MDDLQVGCAGGVAVLHRVARGVARVPQVGVDDLLACRRHDPPCVVDGGDKEQDGGGHMEEDDEEEDDQHGVCLRAPNA